MGDGAQLPLNGLAGAADAQAVSSNTDTATIGTIPICTLLAILVALVTHPPKAVEKNKKNRR